MKTFSPLLAYLRKGQSGPSPRLPVRVHTGWMGRIIGTVLGAILAVWLAVTVAGGIVASAKMFLVIGLIALGVFVVIWLLAGRSRRD